jgi:tetratricopeptide (TPR) repeat protein
VSLSELRSLWDGYVCPSAVRDLVRFFLAGQSGGVYRLTSSAANFVRQQYTKSAPIRDLYQQLLSNLATRSLRAVNVVEQFLLNGWLPPDERLNWITAYWRTGIERGHFATWCTILEGETDGLPELALAYGVCLRRAGYWGVAEQSFRHAARESGRTGDFHTQSAALIEWAILARLQGDYTTALGLLEQSEQCNQYRDETLLRRIQIEQCQIALDTGDGAEALKRLSGAADTLIATILACEAYLLVGETDICRATALQALRRVTEDRRVEASLYTLIARSYFVQEQYEAAWSYFALALTVLETYEDVGAAARAQANLAAALFKLGKPQQAQELLDRSKPVLSVLEDTVGYQATLHNQRLMDIYTARFT